MAVYLIGSYDGCHKIGRSKDPNTRIAAFASELVEPKTRHIIESDNSKWLENYLQAKFADRLAWGEWYRLTPDEVALICSVRFAHTMADLPSKLVKRKCEAFKL